MRIAIYHNLPSGGGKRALLEMTRRLAERHDIAVYTLSTAEHSFCDLRAHCRVHSVYPFHPAPLARRPFGRLNQGIRTVDLLRLEAIQRQLAAQIDRDRCDVAFVHNCQFSQSPGLLKFLKTPCVYYCQEPPRLIYESPIARAYSRFSKFQRLGNTFDPLPGLYRSTLRYLDRKNVRSACMVLANSQYSRETIYRTYGVFAHVGRLGVDTELFHPMPVAKEERVLSVGALTPKKGFDLVIRSLGLIEATRRPGLTIVSNYDDPAERDYLRGQAGSLDVKVEFRVGVSDKELVECYNRSKLMVYAPIMEPFGLVALESMACGTPVVGVCEAGVRETVRHQETGVLVERDAARFATTIDSLLGDSDRMVEYGKQGRKEVVEHWNWDSVVQVLEGYLAQAGEGVA